MTSREKKFIAVFVALVTATGGAVVARKLWHLRAKPPVRLETISGESAILPRTTYVPAGSTRVSPQTISVNGASRKYILVEPNARPEGKTYPLILVYHGDGGDAAGFHAGFPFERATGDDAIVAYPDGIQSGWDLESIIDNRDVRFAEALVEAVATRLPIDRSRVFGTGYSSGGFFVNVLACQRSSLLRAIASNAGGAPYNQGLRWLNGYPKCPGQAPVATLALHGHRDFGVTLDSGQFSAAYWAYVNGCREDEMETTGYPECTAYRGCPQGKAVALCTVPGLGHWVWDHAAEASWTFFQRQ